MPVSNCSAIQPLAISKDVVQRHPIKSDDAFRRLELISTLVGTIAAGCLFIPNFAVGAAAAVIVVLPLNIGTNVGFSLLGFGKKETNNAFIKYSKEHPYQAAITIPMVEEGIFRGVVLNGIKAAAAKVIPEKTFYFSTTAAQFLFGPQLELAALVGIVGSAAIFGLLHLYNPTENSHIQAAAATVAGVCLGVLAHRFCMMSSIACHIVNNSVAVSLVI